MLFAVVLFVMKPLEFNTGLPLVLLVVSRVKPFGVNTGAVPAVIAVVVGLTLLPWKRCQRLVKIFPLSVLSFTRAACKLPLAVFRACRSDTTAVVLPTCWSCSSLW